MEEKREGGAQPLEGALRDLQSTVPSSVTGPDEELYFAPPMTKNTSPEEGYLHS